MVTRLEPARPDDFERLVELWEASVRATHHFVAEHDLRALKPVVRKAIPDMAHLACTRETDGLHMTLPAGRSKQTGGDKP